MADSKSIVERVRAIWQIVEAVVEEAVIAAEGFIDLNTGEEKREYVIEHVTAFIRDLEEQYDLLPDWVEGAALRGVEFALGWMVERVFDRLNADGKVNVATQ